MNLQGCFYVGTKAAEICTLRKTDASYFICLLVFFSRKDIFYILQGSGRYVCVQKPVEAFIRALADQGPRAVLLLVTFMHRKVPKVLYAEGREAPPWLPLVATLHRTPASADWSKAGPETHSCF